MHPGRWPARTFHSATLLMAFFWTLGVLFPIPGFRELLLKPRIEEILLGVQEKYHRRHGGQRRSAGYIGTDPNGNPMFIPIAPKHYHLLENGERLNVKFPSNAGFFPRALSIDDEGLQLLVTGDIGLYMAVAQVPLISSESTAKQPRLSGGNTYASEDQAVTFDAVQPCSGLEGQALRDTSVVCTGHSNIPHCRIFVLVSNGPRILECRLKMVHRHGQPNASMKDPDAPYNVAWNISKEWLYKNHVEQVDSLAIDNTCLRRRESTQGKQRYFLDTQDAGCIVVGTGATSHKRSYGRIVQLKEKQKDRWTLIPERSIHVRNSRINQGALHVLDTGYVLALSAHNDEKDQHKTLTIMEVFSKYSGKMTGAWELPHELNWLTLSGNKTHLFAVGLRQVPWRFELWQFPVPEQLQRPPPKKDPS